MDAPVVELPRGFCEGVERGRRPHEDALQPNGQRFDGLRRRAGLGVNFDDVGSVPRAVVFSEAGHGALLQLLDPLDLSLKSVADVDGKPRVFGIEDIPLGASLEGVGMGFDEVFKSVDSSVELAYFSCMVVLSLFNRFEQRLGDALQGVGVEISAAVKDVSGRAGRDGVVGEGVSGGDRDR